jgi:regulatory protein
MPKPMPRRPVSIKVRALQWLAQREHSRDELRVKLLTLLQRRPARADEGLGGEVPGPEHHASQATTQASAQLPADPPPEVDALLLWLECHGYLSQARFVESRVHARQSRFGNLRIRQELQHHGVTLDAGIQQALQRSEFDRAREVWRKKYGRSVAADVDAAAKMRQMRFLAGRGFSIDVVRRVVKAGAAQDVDCADNADSPGC